MFQFVFTQYLTFWYPKKIEYSTDIMRIKNAAQTMNKTVGDDEKILFIAQKSIGFEVLAAHYELYGRVEHTSQIAYDYPDETRHNKYLTIEKSLDDIKEYIKEKNYSYLWAYKTDEYFKIKVQKIFGINIVEGGFYEIHNEGGNVFLHLIGIY